MSLPIRADSRVAGATDLARRITHQVSGQTFHTIRWLVDRDLTDDAYRAYAYFRWVDDTIDAVSKNRQGQLTFVARQRQLLQSLFAGEQPHDLSAEEELLAQLTAGRGDDHPGLRSYLTNMMAVMEFDAARRGRLIGSEELEEYTRLLATAVMDAIAYFIGHGHRYPESEARTLAVQGAHIVHMLRDTRDDLRAGYYNIPRQVLEASHLTPDEIGQPAYRAWVRSRVGLARHCLHDGKRYIRSMGNARAQIAGLLYCFRFETVLRRIELDQYLLRAEYSEAKSSPAWVFVLAQVLCSVLLCAGRSPGGPGRLTGRLARGREQ